MLTRSDRQERILREVVELHPNMNPLLVIGYLAEVDAPDDRQAHVAKCRRATSNFGLPWDEVIGASRNREFVEMRHMCFKYLRDEGWTLRAIGEMFNGRDHATARHGAITANDLIETSRVFRRKWLTFLQS